MTSPRHRNWVRVRQHRRTLDPLRDLHRPRRRTQPSTPLRPPQPRIPQQAGPAAVAILTPQQREQLGRCHHCEHHPPTQGHAMTCPSRWVWRGGGPHPVDWPPDLPIPHEQPAPTTDLRTDTTNHGTLTLDL